VIVFSVTRHTANVTATVRAHLSLQVCLVQLPRLLCYRITVLLLLNKINDDDDDDDHYIHDASWHVAQGGSRSSPRHEDGDRRNRHVRRLPTDAKYSLATDHRSMQAAKSDDLHASRPDLL